MRISVTPESSFGTITEFTTFDLEFVQRNRFVEPSDLFDITNSIPSDGGFSNSSTPIVRLSPLFTDASLLPSSINPPAGSSRTRNAYDNETVYRNMQRVCYEVLEPVTEFVGSIPTINTGVIFVSNVKGIDQDSFYADQIKGNAVVFSFPNDSTNTQIKDAYNFLSEFCLYDRLIYNGSLTVPTVSVSVNNKKRRIKSTTD